VPTNTLVEVGGDRGLFYWIKGDKGLFFVGMWEERVFDA